MNPLIPELDVSDVTRFAREVAAEYSFPVEIVGAVLGGSDGRYVEIVVDVDERADSGAGTRFTIGVFRDSSEADLRHEIAERVRQHLASVSKGGAAGDVEDASGARPMTPDELQKFENGQIHHEADQASGPASESDPTRDTKRDLPVIPPNPD